MDDRISELYLKRDPKAIEESITAHGHDCRRLAMNILASEREAELCLREALGQAWESISAYNVPAHLSVYLQKLTRTHAIDRYTASQSVKRGYNLFATVLDELGECRPASFAGFSGGFDPEAESVRAGACLTRFLAKKSRETRDMFLCRYFFAESLGEIARRFGLNENRVRSRLRKTCSRLSAFLAQDPEKAWYPTSEAIARGMSYIDDAMILSAHGERKKARRLIPWLAAACVIAVAAVSFPFLREIINTDLKLRGPNWKNEQGNPDVEVADKPSAEAILDKNTPASVGGSTVTVTEVTDTTVTLLLVKTDDTPIYTAVYDRMGDALACTQPGYKVDGVTIRSHTLTLCVDGTNEVLYELPAEAGTYTVVLDFGRIRNGQYPMEDYVGFFSYTGKDGAPEAVYFSILTDPPEEDTTEAPSADAQETT